jgi:hypothetical protein
MFAAEISSGDATAWIGSIVLILGGVWGLLKVAIRNPINERLTEQDHKLDAIEKLAHTANREAATVRDELREHMRREEVAFAAPWWRRHRNKAW